MGRNYFADNMLDIEYFGLQNQFGPNGKVIGQAWR
jgi:hypothetical protein